MRGSRLHCLPCPVLCRESIHTTSPDAEGWQDAKPIPHMGLPEKCSRIPSSLSDMAEYACDPGAGESLLDIQPSQTEEPMVQ